jgi:DNA-binding NtrC family response regulator
MDARILIVDDDARLARALRRTLCLHGYPTDWAADAEEGLARLKEHPYEVLLTDFRMPGLDGLDVLQRARQIRAECEVVLMTAHATVDLARRALLRGAADFVTKPFSPQQGLVPLLERLLASRPRVEGEAREAAPPATPDADSVIGHSPALRALREKARKVAASEATVLLSGESGTGKEVFAGLIHEHSPRRRRPLVKLNCAALPATLLESELFGHRRGSFTGAAADRTGLFEAADGGTLFLDEVGEMALEIQPKLLRALQEGEFHRIGDPQPIRVDVRVIAATNRDLGEAVRRGRFRADLYYRLAVVPLPLPPLRERREDLPALIEHFVRRLAGDRPVSVSDEALQALLAHDWPGNVRELANALEHALVLGDGTHVRLTDLPVVVQERHLPGPPQPGPRAVGATLESVEIRCILQALERTDYNRTRAARLLGITRRTLGYRIRKYDLEDRVARARTRPPELGEPLQVV